MRFKMAGKLLEILVLFCFAVSQLNAFYLPGLAPVNYCKIGKETETCECSFLDDKCSSISVSIWYFQFVAAKLFIHS